MSAEEEEAATNFITRLKRGGREGEGGRKSEKARLAMSHPPTNGSI